MRYNEKFDWETREDADTLLRYQQIKGDSERLRKAQSCIRDSVSNLNKVLDISAPEIVPGRSNPATIRKLSSKDIR